MCEDEPADNDAGHDLKQELSSRQESCFDGLASSSCPHEPGSIGTRRM